MKHLSRFALLSAVLVVASVSLATAWDGGADSGRGGLVEYGTLNVAPELEVDVKIVVDFISADATYVADPNPPKTGQVVILDGSGTTGEPDVISYLWVEESDSPYVTIVDATSQYATFVATVAGNYTFILTATNSFGSDADNVVVTVEAAPSNDSNDSGCSLGAADSSFAGIASWSLPYLMLTGLWAISLIRRKRLSSNS
jgi:K319L-like, PKD domain